jgi:hypothetical protein
MPLTGTVWDGAHAQLQAIHWTLAQLEVASQLLTEASVSLQWRVAISKALALEEGGMDLIRRTSEEDSPPALMMRDQLVQVGEPIWSR